MRVSTIIIKLYPVEVKAYGNCKERICINKKEARSYKLITRVAVGYSIMDFVWIVYRRVHDNPQFS
jgi:hypothetical protein